jgi:hypothetical protein
VIPPRLDAAGIFSEDLAPMRQGELWGYVNRAGEVAVRPAYSLTHPFSNGRGRVLVLGEDKVTRTGFVDSAGKLVVPARYPTASDFSDSRAMVRWGNKYGYIDLNGNLVIPARYDWAAAFEGGLALVKTFAKSGEPTLCYLNPAGKVVWQSR